MTTFHIVYVAILKQWDLSHLNMNLLFQWHANHESEMVEKPKQKKFMALTIFVV